MSPPAHACIHAMQSPRNRHTVAIQVTTQSTVRYAILATQIAIATQSPPQYPRNTTQFIATRNSHRNSPAVCHAICYKSGVRVHPTCPQSNDQAYMTKSSIARHPHPTPPLHTVHLTALVSSHHPTTQPPPHHPSPSRPHICSLGILPPRHHADVSFCTHTLSFMAWSCLVWWIVKCENARMHLHVSV